MYGETENYVNISRESNNRQNIHATINPHSDSKHTLQCAAHTQNWHNKEEPRDGKLIRAPHVQHLWIIQPTATRATS